MIRSLILVMTVAVLANMSAAENGKNRYGDIPPSAMELVKNAVDVQTIGIGATGINITLLGVDKTDPRTSAPALIFERCQFARININDDQYVVIWMGSDRFVYHEVPKKK